MRCQGILWMFLLLLGPGLVIGQEEGSADLFTEPYTDEFQEAFFESLKQKGIENYDRAEALMLDAKKYRPDDPVVDYELARILILARAYNRAEPFALDAVRADPSEYWYVDSFMQTLKHQSKNVDDYRADLPFGAPEFKLNLARWYLAEGRYQKAREQLTPLAGQEDAKQLLQEVNRLEAIRAPATVENKPEASGPSEDSRSIAAFESRLDVLLKASDWKALEEESSSAIERFPLQPRFYYCKGLSLLRQDRAKQAVSVLKEGESYLLEPSEVGQQIYSAMSEAYIMLGDTEKAKKYSDKLKAGL